MLIIRITFITLLLWMSDPKANPNRDLSEEWNFVATKSGVKFYWKEDPFWHQLEIRAENNSQSTIN